MSSIQSVQSSGTAALAAAKAAPKATAAKTESAAQEAQETMAVTQAEARKGDQQAIRRLAQSQATSIAKKTEPVAPSPDGGGGGSINLVA